MFVGLASSNSDTSREGKFGTHINLWTFNSDRAAPDVPRRNNDRNKGRKRSILILVITIPCGLPLVTLVVTIFVLYRRLGRLSALAKKYQIEKGVLDRGPQSFKYRILSTATNGFSSDQLLGTGGFGSVYKGRLVLKGGPTPTDVAVKRISATSSQGAQEFLAEVKIVGQVQHRNLAW